MYISPVLCSTINQSAVHKGAAFERRTLKILQDNLSMSLKHVGGKSDGGIDLVGWWLLPSRIENDPPQRTSVVGVDPETYRHIRVIAQCKAEKKKVGPVYVRELEGAFSRYTDTSRVVSSSPQLNSPIAALLVSES